MANPGETSSPEIRCVFVETSLDTRLALLVHKDEIISDFKEKLANEHKQVFPEIGEINVSALKVKRRRKFYHLSESMNVYKGFDGISTNWFMHADAVRVEKVELLTLMAADQNRLNLELVEKKKEIAVGSVLVDGMDTKDLTLEEGLETEVVEKKIRKRKVRSSDGKTSLKKSKVDVNQSAVATTELSGKVLQGEVASQSCGDDILTDAAIGKVIESGERNDVSMAKNQQTTDADMLSEGRILTANSELVDGHTKGEVKDVPDNQTVKEALEKLDDLTGAIEQDGQITSRDDERGEGSRLAPSTVDNLQTAELVTDAENQLEASSGLTTGNATEKKRKRPKSSRSTAGATTTSRKTVDEINVQSGTVDCVDAISKSCPISERETLENPLVEAVQKETEMGEKSVEGVGRDDIETDNLASHPENHLEANSGLTTAPVTEKKKRQKKSSKDHISQPDAIAAAATAATTSRENVNEIKAIKKKIRGSSKPSQASQSQA